MKKGICTRTIHPPNIKRIEKYYHNVIRIFIFHKYSTLMELYSNWAFFHSIFDAFLIDLFVLNFIFLLVVAMFIFHSVFQEKGPFVVFYYIFFFPKQKQLIFKKKKKNHVFYIQYGLISIRRLGFFYILFKTFHFLWADVFKSIDPSF